jgi:hypothetical protein
MEECEASQSQNSANEPQCSSWTRPVLGERPCLAERANDLYIRDRALSCVHTVLEPRLEYDAGQSAPLRRRPGQTGPTRREHQAENNEMCGRSIAVPVVSRRTTDAAAVIVMSPTDGARRIAASVTEPVAFIILGAFLKDSTKDLLEISETRGVGMGDEGLTPPLQAIDAAAKRV